MSTYAYCKHCGCGLDGPWDLKIDDIIKLMTMRLIVHAVGKVMNTPATISLMSLLNVLRRYLNDWFSFVNYKPLLSSIISSLCT